MYDLKIATALIGVLLLLRSGNEEIRSVEIVYSFPFAIQQENGRSVTAPSETVTTLFYSSHYRLYRFDSRYDLYTEQPVTGTEKYFLSRPNVPYGYLFAPDKDSSRFQKLNADSLAASFRWNINRKDKNGLDTAYSENWIRSPAKDSLLDVIYRVGHLKDELQPDSVCFYYTKNDNDLPFSLSPRLDSVEGMKLYKIRLVYRDRYSDKTGKLIPSAETRIQMSRKTVKDPDTIRHLIAHFRKVCGL